MVLDGLVYGLLNTAQRIGDPCLAAKLRSFTIAWSRYDYHGRIVESDTVNGILDTALEAGYRWCLIQAYGHILSEHWFPSHWERVHFAPALAEWLPATDFFAAGTLIETDSRGCCLDDRFLLVDLA